LLSPRTCKHLIPYGKMSVNELWTINLNREIKYPLIILKSTSLISINEKHSNRVMDVTVK